MTRGEARQKPVTGFSTIEVLVAIALMGALAIAGGAFFSSTFGAWMKGRELADQQQNARLVLEWMVRRIRLAGVNVPTGPGFTTTSDSIAFSADLNLDGTGERYRYCLDAPAGVVREQVDGQVSGTCTAGAPMTSRGIRTLRVVRLGIAGFDGFGNPTPSAIARARITLALDSNRNGLDDTGGACSSVGTDVCLQMDAVVRNR